MAFKVMYRILVSLYTVTETDFISVIKRNELNFFYDLKKPICSRPLLKIIHKGMEEKKELSREFILITQIEKLLSKYRRLETLQIDDEEFTKIIWL
jgi:hypothetical protein